MRTLSYVPLFVAALVACQVSVSDPRSTNQSNATGSADAGTASDDPPTSSHEPEGVGGDGSVDHTVDAGPSTSACVPAINTNTYAYRGDLAALDLGRGINSLTATPLGRCTEAPATSGPSCTNTGSRTFRMELVKSTSSLKAALGLSAAASYGVGVYKADASASYFRSDSITSDSAYLLLDVEVRYQDTTLSNLALTKEGLAKLHADPAVFVASCGDQFVSSIVRGGLFRAVYQFVGVEESHKNELAAKFSGKTSNWSASAEFKQTLEQVSSRYETRLFVMQSGGTLATVALSPDELIKQAASFGTDQGSSGLDCEHAYPIAVQTSPYYAATNFPVDSRYPDVSRQMREIENTAVDFDAARVLKNDIAARIARPGRLDQASCAGDKNKLVSKQSEIDDYLDAAADKISACQIPDPCGPSSVCLASLTVPEIALPRLDDPANCGPACTDGNGSSYETDDRGYCTRCTFAARNVTIGGGIQDDILRSSCRYIRPGAHVVVRVTGDAYINSDPSARTHATIMLTLGSPDPNSCPAVSAPCGFVHDVLDNSASPFTLTSDIFVGPTSTQSSVDAWFTQIDGASDGKFLGAHYDDVVFDFCDADRPEGCATP